MHRVKTHAINRAICISLLSLSLSAGTIAQAETISFTPDAPSAQDKGTFTGQIAVKSIGSLALPQGLAVFNGHSVEIQAVPDWLFDRNAVLTGAMIHSSMTTSGPNAIVKGLAYFNGGDWITNLAAVSTRDTIRTVGGGAVTGTIQAILPDGLEILDLTGSRRKILFSDIDNISSPRAFNFAATAESLKLDPASTAMQGESNQIVFVPVAAVGRIAMHKTSVPRSNLAGTEGGVPNSLIASEILIDVAVNIIAPAVAIPLCFAVNRNGETINKIRAAQAASGTFGPINP